MDSSGPAVARQRTVNNSQYVDEALVEEPQDLEKQTTILVPTRENSMPFWQRFKGVGRKKVGVVESLKAIMRSSCSSCTHPLVHCRSSRC